MKLKKSMEQAVCVLLLLELEKKYTPIKSKKISERLEVSDSYLKKILRKLVVENLISSDASKDGGFSLARDLSEISMLDVYNAIEGRGEFLNLSNLAERVFNDKKKIVSREMDIMKVIKEGEELFLKKLDSYPLSRLIGTIDIVERK